MSDDKRPAAAALTPGAQKADRPPPQSPGGHPAAAPGGDTLPAAGDQTAAREPPVDRLSPTVDFQPAARADDQFAPTVDFVRGGTKPRSSPASTGLVVGDYRIESELGRGGMGVVYRAHDRKLNRAVALKMILAGPHADAQALARFRVEGQAVARLAHPGIVQIFELGEHEGLPFFALEFVAGGNLLRQLIKELPSPAEAARLMEKLARTMQHAHDQGILHRDLKPANILLTPEGEPKISDFGLAKPIDAEEGMTRTGSILGTPEYMSPEQAKGLIASLTPATDQYSLGAILYHLLTGRPPFLSDNPIDTVFQVIVEDPIAPRRLAPKVPADLETICLKAIAKEPARRYASCRELADDLHRFLAGEPIVARPASRVERAWRWCRRNPRIAIPTAASAALFLVAFAVVAWSAWTLSKLNASLIKQRIIAESAKAKAENERTLTQQAHEAQKEWTLGTLGALKHVVLTVGPEPDLQPLKKTLVQTAERELKDLREKAGGSVTTAATVLAFHIMMRDLYLSTGDTAEAARHLSAAEAIARERVIVQNGSSASRLNLALICRSMAELRRQHTRDMQTALKYARESADLYEDVLKNPRPQPGDPPRLQTVLHLSEIHSVIAVVFVRLGDPAQALAHFEKTQSLREGILSDREYLTYPPDRRQKNEAGFREESAVSLAAIGEMHFRLGRPAEAQKHYEEAVAIRREVLAIAEEEHSKARSQLEQDADKTEASQDINKPQRDHVSAKLRLDAARLKLSQFLSNAGQIDMFCGASDKAAMRFDEVIGLTTDLVCAELPAREDIQALALAHFRRGVLRERLRQPGAWEDFEDCLKLRSDLAKDATNIDRQREFLLVLPRCGKHGEAVALADKILAAVPKPDIELLLDLARAYAQCSVAAAGDAAAAEAFQKQALDRLAQAVEAGHRDPVYLQHEPDFEPLRKLERFQALVAQAKMAAGKPAH